MVRLLLFAALFQAPGAVRAEHDPYREEIPALALKFETGDWNERIHTLKLLGPMGGSALAPIGRALKDPDWQVRLTAAHWLGRYGPAAEPALRDALEAENCPFVRLSLTYVLGGLGASLREGRGASGEDSARCESWFWPPRQRNAGIARRTSRTTGATAADEAGCSYVRFRRPGQMTCPEGAVVRGVGPAPRDIKVLKESAPQSGVALCCPARPDSAEVPEPLHVECRLHPIECPAPWVELEAPDVSWSRKDRKHRRTGTLRRESTNWVHCCRPALRAPESPEPEGGSQPADRLDDWQETQPEGRDAIPGTEPEEPEERYYVEQSQDDPELGKGDVESMPERQIALRALEREARARAQPAAATEEGAAEPTSGSAAPDPNTSPEGVRYRGPAGLDPTPGELRTAVPGRAALKEREFELDRLFVGLEEELAAPEPQTLPRPVSVDGRQELEVSAPAEHDLPGRARAEVELGAPEADLGAPQGPLSRPAGVPARGESQVRADAAMMADAGAPPPEHDPLPALLKSLEDADPRKRSLAADAIGGLGDKGSRAAPALLAALRDENPGVRSSAALALGGVTRGTDRAVAPLRRALKDKHVDVRYSAAEALGRIGTAKSRRAFSRHARGAAGHFLRGGAAAAP